MHASAPKPRALLTSLGENPPLVVKLDCVWKVIDPAAIVFARVIVAIETIGSTVAHNTTRNRTIVVLACEKNHTATARATGPARLKLIGSRAALTPPKCCTDIPTATTKRRQVHAGHEPAVATQGRIGSDSDQQQRDHRVLAAFEEEVRPRHTPEHLVRDDVPHRDGNHRRCRVPDDDDQMR